MDESVRRAFYPLRPHHGLYANWSPPYLSVLMTMERAELVFIPMPAIGHFIPGLELCKLLVDRDGRLSITVLLIKQSFDPKFASYTESIAASTPPNSRIKFIGLPKDGLDLNSVTLSKNLPETLISSNRSHVKQAISELISTNHSGGDPFRLAGLLLDMLCTSMIDVANEFGVPSYIFTVTSAAYLGLMFQVQDLCDNEGMDPTEFKDSDAELVIPALVNPLPARVMPSCMLDKEWLQVVLHMARRFREAKGILINTFAGLESHAISSHLEARTQTTAKTVTPPVYHVGPLLDLKGTDSQTGRRDTDRGKDEIMQWLDRQPPSSVLYLCFGSTGSFSADQVKEIACALEHSGHRFLWSLRKPPSNYKMETPMDYPDQEYDLPDGFLDRTANIGKVMGWAPQKEVLAHPSVGGFVSHCGWNSVLEGIWFGVPVATWPLFVDQSFNAFQMVVELGLSVEIKMDYRRDRVLLGDKEDFVTAEKIEKGIRCVMDHENERIKRLKDMSKEIRKAQVDGGSSYISIGSLLQDIMDNIP